MPVLRIDRRSVAGLRPDSAPVTYFDDKLKGFGIRVMPSGVRTYVVNYRPGDGGRGAPKRQYKLGNDSDAYRAEKARDDAERILARVRLGQDPAADRSRVRTAETVADLLDAYMEDRIKPKRKQSTAKVFEGYIRNHINPAVGSKSAVALTRADVARLHREVGKGQQVTANRVVTVLAAAYRYAAKIGLVPEELRNPASGIERFKESSRERFLTADELLRLGETLRLAETDGLPWEPDPAKKTKHAPKPENRRVEIDPFAIAALRLLLFTGARLREILHLKWEWYDAERGLLLLPDSKTGRKTIVLGAPAIEVLTSLSRPGDYVIAGTAKRIENGEVERRRLKEKPRSDLNKPWARIKAHAKLDGLRIHDLRHSFASVGAGAGLGLPIIGKLLGHADAATTARYAHLDADPLRRATDAISSTIAAALAGSVNSNVISLTRREAA